jgi:hypothetical protein
MTQRVYLNLTDFNQSLNTDEDAPATIDYNLKRKICLRASKILEQYCDKRIFVPQLQTRTYRSPTQVATGVRNISLDSLATPDSIFPDFDAKELRLYADLLSVTSLTIDGDSVSPGDLILIGEDERYNTYPYNIIYLDEASTFDFYLTGDARLNGIVIVGEWGMVENYDIAWRDTSIQNQNAMTAVSTNNTIDIPTDSMDELLVTSSPFKIYQYIRIEDEDMLIVDITEEEDGDVLQVIRAVNGSTIATHAATTNNIFVYDLVDDLSEALVELGTYLYQKKDISLLQDRPIRQSDGTLILPSQWPSMVTSVFEKYTRDSI